MVTKQRVLSRQLLRNASSLSRGVRKDVLEERVLAVSWLPRKWKKHAGTICGCNVRPIKAASLVRQVNRLSTDRVGGWALKKAEEGSNPQNRSRKRQAKAATRLKIRTGLIQGETENPKLESCSLLQAKRGPAIKKGGTHNSIGRIALLLFIRRCSKVQARGCRRDDKACPSPDLHPSAEPHKYPHFSKRSNTRPLFLSPARLGAIAIGHETKCTSDIR